MLTEALATSGADQQDIDTMVFMRLEQDLHGNLFSGLDELDGTIAKLRSSKGKSHTIEVDMPALKLLNANGRSAMLVGMQVMVPLVCQMAKTQGIAIVGQYNGGYHGVLETYARAIAAEGLVGIIAANGGPQGVVPFGGSKDIFGTNPLAYGIPTNDLPIVFDAATAKYAYGSIRLAKKQDETLPKHAYLDHTGHWTTDPHKATAIVPFGEHKGYAINLMLDVLTGCLVQAKSGLQLESEAELGSFFIAINPAAFGSLVDFKRQTSQLAKDIEAVKPAPGFTEVRVPGFSGERRKQQTIKTDTLKIPDNIWQEFEAAHRRLTVD